MIIADFDESDDVFILYLLCVGVEVVLVDIVDGLKWAIVFGMFL